MTTTILGILNAHRDSTEGTTSVVNKKNMKGDDSKEPSSVE